jgi:predicted phosphohydrolase
MELKSPPENKESFRLVCISDTHNKTNKLRVPPGDVLIHCGDFTFNGSYSQVIHFNNFFGSLPHPIKIFIAGNHDACFDIANYESILQHYKVEEISDPRLCISTLSNYIYLEDSGINLYGYKIWGTPWIREHNRGAFSINDKNLLKSKRDCIPPDVDILVTHCPPKGILDRNVQGMDVGCEFLLETVRTLKPKYHFFGHIHEGYGIMYWNQTVFINASICNRKYLPINIPIVLDLPIIK